MNSSEYSIPRLGMDFATYSGNGTRRLMNATEYAAAYPMNSSGYSMSGSYEMYSSNETRQLTNATEYGAAYPTNASEYAVAYPMNTSSDYGYLRSRR